MIAIIVMFNTSRLDSDPDALAEQVKEACEEDGLQPISVHPWGGDPTAPATNMGAVGAMTAASVNLSPAPASDPGAAFGGGGL